jgi:hypothetical protein
MWLILKNCRLDGDLTNCEWFDIGKGILGYEYTRED